MASIPKTRTQLISVLLCTAFLAMAQLPPLIPYRKGQKWGASDSTKKIIIPPVYTGLKYLGKHLICANDRDNGDKCTLYDTKGKLIGVFNDAAIHGDGYVHVWKGDDNIQYHGLLSLTGEAILPTTYRYIGDVHEGLIAVSNGKKNGFLNLSGEIVVPFIYDYVQDFSNGRAWVSIDSAKTHRVGSVDKKGDEIWLDGYDVVSDLGSNTANVWTKNKHGVVNKKGEFLVPLQGGSVENLNTEHFTSTMVQKKKALWRDGKKLSEEKYDQIRPKTNGYFEVMLGNLYGLIDSTGKEIIPPEYQVLGEVKEEMVLVATTGKFGYYDLKGNKIPLNYEYTEGFRHGIAPVKVNGKWGAINKQGKTILPARYEQVSVTDYGSHAVMCVQMGKEYGLLNETGEEITAVYYSSCPYFSGNYIVAQCGNKYGILKGDTSVFILFRYDNIIPITTGRWLLEKDSKKFVADSTGMVKELPAPYRHISYGPKYIMGNLPDGRVHFLDLNANNIIQEFKRFPFHPYPGPNRIVEKTEGKYGVISPEGEMLIRPDYDYLSRDVHIVPLDKDVSVLFWASRNGQPATLVDIHGTFYGED